MNEKMLEMTMISLDDGVVMPELSFYLDATTREACEAVGHAVKNEECIFLANPVHKNGDKTVSFYERGYSEEQRSVQGDTFIQVCQKAG